MNYALALPLPLLFLAASSGLGKRFRNPNRLVTSTDPVGILVADLNGDGRLDIVATYEVGTHPVVASYTGAGAFNPSQSTPLSLVIQPANSATTLSASPNPASVSSTVTLQAVVHRSAPADRLGCILRRRHATVQGHRGGCHWHVDLQHDFSCRGHAHHRCQLLRRLEP